MRHKQDVLFVFSAVLVLLPLMLICGCGKNGKVPLTKNQIIRKPGLYSIDKQGIQITVWAEDLIVRYRVTKDGKAIVESVDRPSTTQRWFVCWDENGWLWFDSSDIGGTVWRPEAATGRYSSTPLTSDRALIRSMPSEVFDALPTTLQEQWQEFCK